MDNRAEPETGGPGSYSGAIELLPTGVLCVGWVVGVLVIATVLSESREHTLKGHEQDG